MTGHFVRTALVTRRKVQATVRLYAPNLPGYTRATMAETMGYNPEKGKLILETLSKFRLRLVTQPHDDGIPSNGKLSASCEYVPAPCTHRPSNHSSRV